MNARTAITAAALAASLAGALATAAKAGAARRTTRQGTDQVLRHRPRRQERLRRRGRHHLRRHLDRGLTIRITGSIAPKGPSRAWSRYAEGPRLADADVIHWPPAFGGIRAPLGDVQGCFCFHSAPCRVGHVRP